jgi:subtilisin family serine protease
VRQAAQTATPGPPSARRRARAGALALAVLAAVLAGAAPAAGSTPTGSAPVAVIVRELPGAGDGPERRVAALGGRVTRRLAIVDGFAASLPGAAVDRLRRAAGVASVTPDARLAPLDDGWDDDEDGDEQRGGWDADGDLGSLDNVTRMIGARSLLADGYTGRGVDVALVDTGVVPVAGLDGRGKLVNGADLSFESQAPNLRYLDSNGHGTHMAGIIAGRDRSGDDDDDEERGFRGVAPDARLVNVKVGAASGATDVSQVLAAIDWVVAHRRDNGLNIRVLNLSYGTDGVQDYLLDPLTYAVEVAWRKGIVVVVAAGNRGQAAGRLNNPAYDPRVLAVGASDPQATLDTRNDLVAEFSSRGDPSRGVDLVAPGTSIVGLRNPGSMVDQEHPLSVVDERFARGSGTSQAAAVTSGAVALLLQKRPALAPDQVKALLGGGASQLGAADQLGQGRGLLNVDRAARASVPSAAAAAQPYPAATGQGSLELARGSAHLVADGIELAGEQDIFGNPWDGRMWSESSWNGTAWSGGAWNGRMWSGDAWASDSFGAQSWAGRMWSGRMWSGEAWGVDGAADNSFSGRMWSGRMWSGDTWSGRMWSGRMWSGRMWSGDVWS